MPRASDVFVQNKQPVHTYVNRSFVHPRTGESRDPELQIGKILNAGDTIVQVVGPSKSGKTVALRSFFNESRLVKIGGSQVADPDRLWALVCAELRVQVSQKQSADTTTSTSKKTEASAKGSLYAAEFGLSREHSTSSESGSSRQVEFIDNLFDLATTALLRQDKVLFIDDFHVVPEDKKKLLAASLKQASEKGVKICLAEVRHRADELQAYLPDLVGRVERVDFGYWRNEDIAEIASKGFLILQVDVPDIAVTALVAESGGSPQLMQLLCLKLCERFDISASRTRRVKINFTLADLAVICINALQTIGGGTSILVLERGTTEDRNKRPRWTTRAATTIDLYEACIAAIAMNPPLLQLHVDAGDDCLVTRMQRLVSSGHDQIRVTEIRASLRDIAETAAGLNPSLPFIHYDEAHGVTVLDPYMLFYVRWSQKYCDLRNTV